MWIPFILIFFVGISTAPSAATPDNTRFHCFEDSKPKTNVTIPLAKEFSAFVLADSPLSSIEWEIFVNQIENSAQNISVVARTDLNGSTTTWYMNYTDETATIDFPDKPPEHLKMSDEKWKKENPLNISENFLNPNESVPKSLLELIQWAQNQFKYTVNPRITALVWPSAKIRKFF